VSNLRHGLKKITECKNTLYSSDISQEVIHQEHFIGTIISLVQIDQFGMFNIKLQNVGYIVDG